MSGVNRAGDGPKAIGQSIIRDLENFSAGHAQFDDIILICFGPVAPAGFQPDSTERVTGSISRDAPDVLDQ